MGEQVALASFSLILCSGMLSPFHISPQPPDVFSKLLIASPAQRFGVFMEFDGSNVLLDEETGFGLIEEFAMLKNLQAQHRIQVAMDDDQIDRVAEDIFQLAMETE